MRNREVPEFIRKGVGGLFLFTGAILIGTEIYLGWQDGTWNRYPLSTLVEDFFHVIGQIIGDMAPVLQIASEWFREFGNSTLPLFVQRFLGGIPMASLFMVTAYIFLKWEKLMSRAS